MFLIERLVGVGVYSLVLVLFCVSLVGKSGKEIKRLLFFYSIVLSIMAYNYVPYKTADLYRIYEYVEIFKNYSFSQLWENTVTNSDLGSAAVLYWAFAKIGMPKLLPSVAAFVCYNCIFYIISKTAEKHQISGTNVAIALFFYMTTETYMSIIAGIRCMLGVVLLAFCFFRENYEKKVNILHLPLYIISFFIHAFSAVLIILRFIIPVLSAQRTILSKIVHLSVFAVAMALLYNYTGDYLVHITSRAWGYIENDMYSYGWGYIIDLFAWITMVAVIYRHRRYKEDENATDLNGLKTFLCICLFSAIAFCFEYSIFTRLILHISPILCLPILMNVLQKNDSEYCKNDENKMLTQTAHGSAFNYLFVCASVLLLLLSCSRGEMSGLKFFVL